jgi:hypothetical protein
MGREARTMVILANRTVCPAVIAIVSVFTMLPGRLEACEPFEFRGRVKSVVETEALVDSATGNIGRARQVLRIDVSQSGDTAKTTLSVSGRSAQPPATSTTYFENGRPVRRLESQKGKTVPAGTCSYDAQGRLVEARIGSEYSESGSVDTYEYGPGVIRLRSNNTFSGPSVITQTLDANGRVIKEVVVHEATSTVHLTIEITYDGDRKTVCGVSARDPRRQCATTVVDSRGNEIEFLAEGQTRKTAFEYDSVGNWISKRTSVTGPVGGTVETIVQRKIEYW